MIISALISFFGGSVFRMVWGEVSAFLTAKQEHSFEIERLKLQGSLEAQQHERNLEAIKVQADLGVKVIEAQSQAFVTGIEAEGWLEAVKGTKLITGIKFVDAWNAVIRPGVATWSVLMMTASELKWLTMSEATASVCFAALGIYLADRSLGKRGK